VLIVQFTLSVISRVVVSTPLFQETIQVCISQIDVRMSSLLIRLSSQHQISFQRELGFGEFASLQLLGELRSVGFVKLLRHNDAGSTLGETLRLVRWNESSGLATFVASDDETSKRSHSRVPKYGERFLLDVYEGVAFSDRTHDSAGPEGRSL
jgi:hypothetical protein